MGLDLTRYPRVNRIPSAVDWLTILEKFQRAENTLAAYAANLDGFLGFLAARRTKIQAVDRRQLADYVDSCHRVYFVSARSPRPDSPRPTRRHSRP
jgi:site-specific recombinase XerD